MHVYLGKCRFGKYILHEIFLYLICVLQHQAHMLCLNISLLIWYQLLLKDVGAKGKTCDGMYRTC